MTVVATPTDLPREGNGIRILNRVIIYALLTLFS